MSVSGVGLSLLLASSPASPTTTRLNLEPILLGIAGLAGAGVGAWRLAVADARYQALQEIPLSAGSAAEAASRLREARSFVFQGKAETVAGVTLLAAGATLVAGSVLWLLLEGVRTPDWLVAPGPQGMSVVGRF
ncbi:MAG: hypothetical protein JNJ54_05915 [Myxococcaceae bacterium]|nr:hypothetical protein [Myxococcaceae bacterium]